MSYDRIRSPWGMSQNRGNQRVQPHFSATLVLCACLSLLIGQSNSARAEEVFTPRHLTKLQIISQAVISPDGTHAAFLRAVPRDPYAEPSKYEDSFEDGQPWTQLFVSNLVNAGAPIEPPLPFVTGNVNVSKIEWTPDDKSIAFLTKRDKDKNTSLYLIALAGGEARRILTFDTDITDYSFSPDGKRVAFVAREEPAEKKKSLEKKGFKADIFEEDFRQDRVWIADLAASASPPRMLELSGSASELHWSPVGQKLALALAPTPLVDDEYMKRKIHIVDVESGVALAKIENPGKLGVIEWSPDANHIAFISAADINDPSAGRLMIASATTGQFADVLPDYQGDVEDIAWQDADTVMFVGSRSVLSEFGKVKIDASDMKIIVPPGDGPVLTSLSLSDDGQRGVFLGASPQHPAEMFFMKHGDDAPKRITDSNPWLAEMRFAKQETIEYRARDKLALQGILIHPLDEEPGKRYPLIVTVHGGPEAHESNDWLTNYSNPGQVAAALGFAVFYPNYRGSTGRGVKFSKLDQAAYAKPEFDDLVDGVDHLVGMGLVDKDRVGVTGGSYGGYASAWCATALTERFAASVMFVGVSDLISKEGTTDIPNEGYLVHARKWPWDGNWDWFRERSPIYHADKCRTPILIMHGTDDPRVPVTQSKEMYRYLKLIDKAPVRLVLYPGEQHGNRKAAARLDYNLRMLQWMEHYLKDGDRNTSPPAYEIEYNLPVDKKKKNGDEATSQPTTSTAAE